MTYSFLKCLLPQSAYNKAAEQLLKTIQDNTDKARIEYQKFANTHDLMISTLNEAGSFIWRKDQAGRYLLANRAMCHSLLTGIHMMSSAKPTRKFWRDIQVATRIAVHSWKPCLSLTIKPYEHGNVRRF
ncbi:MAG: hypothetical protein VR64_20350 [Desulfatitalea sp. BRH_c12]|nr:MAG: hypothetical protein VR64_20350 [Desulfatitalea sp. BRH_c12]